MDRTLLQDLEKVVLARNPLLKEKLQPAISEHKIRKDLARARVTGAIAPLIDLYSWKNGTILDRDLAAERIGFFPREIFHMLELENAIDDFDLFREASIDRPELTEAAGRYFPLFWDGSARWLAVDLAPAAMNRIVLVDLQSTMPFKQAYASFEQFVAAVIYANKENTGLSCFDMD